MQDDDIIEQAADPGPQGQEHSQDAPADAQPGGEQAAPQEPQGEQPRDDKGRFRGVQGRIDELTRARHEAEREAAYWKGRAGTETQPGQAPPSAAQAATAKPTPDKFSDYGEYVEALADWKADEKVRQALGARDQAEQQRQQALQQQERARTWGERQQAARQALPDYEEVMATADTPVARHLFEALIDSENGPALAYHLAKHPDEAQRLNGLAPLAAARELGRLEARLSGSPAAATAKPVSKAPAPITPVTGGRSTEPDMAKVGMDEYVQRRKAQGARWAR